LLAGPHPREPMGPHPHGYQRLASLGAGG
jgi:hypothetical protein